MQYQPIQNGFIIRLLKGEKLIESLQKILKKENINSGSLHGLGGATEVELGFYNIEEKAYEWKRFNETLEIVSLLGNISLVDNQPFIHAHMVISNRNFQCFGGHMKEAIVGATCEIVINRFETQLIREFDDEIGLKLLKL